MTADLTKLEGLIAKATKGPWRARAEGGHSVITAPVMPPRNDRRCEMPHGFAEEHGWSIAYPFLEDHPADVRPDFVCFSHDDARLIVEAVNALPSLLVELARMREALTECVAARKDWINSTTERGDVDAARRMDRAHRAARAVLSPPADEKEKDNG